MKKINLITSRNVKMQKKHLAKFMILEEEDLKNQQVLHKENGLCMSTHTRRNATRSWLSS